MPKAALSFGFSGNAPAFASQDVAIPTVYASFLPDAVGDVQHVGKFGSGAVTGWRSEFTQIGKCEVAPTFLGSLLLAIAIACFGGLAHRKRRQGAAA